MSAPDELKLWKISLLSIHTAVNMRRGLELDKVTKELNYQSQWEHEGQRAHKMSCHVMSCESSEDGTAPAEPAAGLAGVVRRGQWCEVSVDLQQESEVRILCCKLVPTFMLGRWDRSLRIPCLVISWQSYLRNTWHFNISIVHWFNNHRKGLY